LTVARKGKRERGVNRGGNRGKQMNEISTLK